MGLCGADGVGLGLKKDAGGCGELRRDAEGLMGWCRLGLENWCRWALRDRGEV